MIKTRVYVRSVLIMLVFVTTGVNAQETVVTSDLEMWNNFEVSKKINKRWKVSLSEELRFTKDISRFDVFLTEIGLGFKINKHFSADLGYRFYQNKNSDNVFKSQHRMSAGFEYKKKLDRFELAYKIQFQNKDEDFISVSLSDRVYNLRNKLSIDYNINHFKLDPYFEVELFRKYESGEDASFNKVRWTLGTSYPVTKKSDIQLYYRLESDLNKSYSKNIYILGFGYKFSF